MNIVFEILVGALLGAGCCLALARWFPACMRDVLVLAIVYIAAIYVGPAIGSLQTADLLELAASLMFSFLALFALRGNDTLLAAAYLGHGLWDALHGPLLHAALPVWYGPMCLGFDWVAAAFILRGLPARR